MPKTYVKLAEAMNARRLELGLRWADVTARGGPSVEQMVLIRRGTVSNIRDLTLAAIAKGLDWPLEHVQQLATGDDAGDGEAEGLDRFERAVVADPRLTDTEKAAAIQDHRKLIVEKLEELHIDPPPMFLRGGVRHLSGESASSDEVRGASGT